MPVLFCLLYISKKVLTAEHLFYYLYILFQYYSNTIGLYFGTRAFYTKKVRSGYGAGTALIRHRCFRRYLKPGVSVPYTSLQPGDVFIKGGSPGHAVIVVDVAIYTQTGKKVFLLAQSYMPAQQIHILVNPANRGLSPWYELSDNDEGKLYTPEWVFEKKDLKRFK